MKVRETPLAGLLIIEPDVFGDHRGQFIETWQKQRYEDAGITMDFVQDNQSISSRGVLRGLHYQIQHPQGKLVRVTQGAVWDVAVDLRRDSPTFGQWFGMRLDGDKHHQLWVPPGFAHGFYVLSDTAEFHYKCTDYYAPKHERTLLWSDEQLAIDWPIADDEQPRVSEKDATGKPLASAEVYF